MEKKRFRAPNYTSEESIHLSGIIDNYKNILENKKTDAASLHEKQNAWNQVAEEYNSTTTSFHRSLKSLQLNYKNVKRKAKKQLAARKMAIPVKRKLLIETISHYGDDWQKVSDTVGAWQKECEDAFTDLKAKAIKIEKDTKKKILGTGGGPSASTEDPLSDKVCSLVGPAMDGLYNIYDGDSMLMASQNVPPLETTDWCRATTPPTSEQISINPPPAPLFDNNRANLKRKPNQKLIVPKRRRIASVTSKFKTLADEKMEVVSLQKKLLTIQIKAEEERLMNLKLENDILSLKLQKEKDKEM